jgi:hypothetical protein
MTVAQYQADVVGMGAAGEPGGVQAGFVVCSPGTAEFEAASFVEAGIYGPTEWINQSVFQATAYVPFF